MKIIATFKGINTFKVSNNQLDCVNGTEKMSHGDALNFLSVNSIQLNSYGGILVLKVKYFFPKGLPNSPFEIESKF